MSRLKVIFVTPPYHAGVVEAAGTWLPLWAVYAAGHARMAGAEARILDAMSLQMTHTQIARELEAWKPDMVCVSAITATEPDAREICATAKRVDPRIVTVLGGVHPTFCWRGILADDANVDLVVVGEGEETIADLVRAFEAGEGFSGVSGLALRIDGAPARTAPRAFAASLDALEPAWDLLEWPIYSFRPRPEGRLAIVNSSRGEVGGLAGEVRATAGRGARVGAE